MRIARLRSQYPQLESAAQRTEDTLGKTGKALGDLRQNFPHRYSSTEISTINLSETLIILRYLSRLSLPVAAFIRTLL